MKSAILFTTALLLLALHGCGGGSSADSSSAPTLVPVGGIGRTGIAMGPITTFGSVVVNGVRYNTDSATVTINDSVGTEAALSVGQVVVVNGTIDDNGTTGTATQVTFDENVKGPIQSIDSAAGQLVVLGQIVQVSASTSFDDSISPASLDGLTIGDIVEVSGLPDANGTIVATRIELKPAGTLFEVHGFASNLDAATAQFNINSLVVDYSGATLDNFASGVPANGDFVEAKGSSLGAAGELVASKVELETVGPGGTAGNFLEIEGFITRFVSATDFDVANIPVTTTASTVYVGGVAGDLGLNIKVEVEGQLDSNGVIVAQKVDIRRAKAVRATANVDSIDSANNSLVMLSVTVKVDGLTRLEDKSDADVRPLTLNDLASGDYLEVRGDEFPAGSGEILATILEREDPETETELQGFVATIAEPAFTILGVTIETNGSTVFRNANDQVISSTDFFAQLSPNSLVKADGTETSASVITATEVEFENEF